MPIPVSYRLCAGFFLWCTLAGAAQTATQSPGNLTKGDVPIFRSDVNLMNLYFNVKDRRGSPIGRLSKDDFLIADDGRPQAIQYFSAEAGQPLTLGMLLDTSESLTPVWGMEQEAGAQFLQRVLRVNDRACLIGFDAHVYVLQEFTNSAETLRTALDGAYTGMGMDVGGRPPRQESTTRLHDAVVLAAGKTLSGEAGRKAMILLTDGVDQGSYETLEAAIEAAQKADAIVYVILFHDWVTPPAFRPPAQFGREQMKPLADQTGGRVIEAGTNKDGLKAAFDQIAADLRSQYYIGYTAADSNLDDKFHRIEIKTKNKGYRVQARTGYYATKHAN